MVVINNGEVFVNGNLTNDPELIGYAVLDFAEAQEEDSEMIIIDQVNLNYSK